MGNNNEPRNQNINKSNYDLASSNYLYNKLEDKTLT